MADVVDFRNFRSHQLDNDDSPLDDDTEFIDEGVEEGDEEKAPESKGRLLLGALIPIVIGAVLVLLILLQSQARTYTTATYSKVMDLLTEESVHYYSLDTSIVSVSRDGASAMDTRGRQVWNITFDMQQPIVASAGSYMAIGDYDGSTIYLVSGKESIGTMDTNMPIRALQVAENGEVAAVLNDTNTTWIYLFDASGNTIAYFKTTMSQSGYPLAAAISPNGQVVAVSHLTIGTEQVNTSISFHNFGAAGQNAVEKNVGGFNFENEICPYLVYLNDSTCAAVTDKKLLYFTGTDSPAQGATVSFDGQVQGVYSNSRYIVLVFADTSGEAEWDLQVYDTSGNLVGTIPFSMDYTCIQLCGDRIVINDAQNLMIYSVDGTKKFGEVLDKTIRAVIPMESSSSRLTLITDTEMDSMRLE